MHPIFDLVAYPWHRSEANELYVRLYQVINASPDIDTAYNGCGPNLPPLNLAQAPDKVWKEALESLSKLRLLQTLCNKLQNNLSPALVEAVNKVVNSKSVVDRTYIIESIPILDRQTLRDSLLLLASDNDPVKV